MDGKLKAFLLDVLEPIEGLLEAHELTKQHFTGAIKTVGNEQVEGLTLKQEDDAPCYVLSSAQVARLFIIPDGHTVEDLHKLDDEAIPAGRRFSNRGQLIQRDDRGPDAEVASNVVVVYRQESGAELAMSALYIARLFFDHDAPFRLGTVGFAWMAVTAYRNGFDAINLFAAGHGPVDDDSADAIGFDFWPKVGFDAKVDPARLNGPNAQHLRKCKTIQDVRRDDPTWWPQYGWSCDMTFDLKAGSRSWDILLNYIFNKLT